MKLFLRFLLAGLLIATGLTAAERIPPAPPQYFNDNAGVVSRPVAEALNRQLEQFERDTSSQLLVAIYPKMESDSSVEDYTVRVAQAWKAGQQGKNNGAVLFAFMQEHQLYLQVGYGLEGTISDAIAKRIIEREIVPRFRAHDIDGGMTAAVNAMIAATRGEYQGTGQTVAEQRSSSNENAAIAILVITFLVIFAIVRILLRGFSNRPAVFTNPTRRGPVVVWSDNNWWNSGGGGSSWSGGDGGGFSGGGGSFGGGGAGGKW